MPEEAHSPDIPGHEEADASRDQHIEMRHMTEFILAQFQGAKQRDNR